MRDRTIAEPDANIAVFDSGVGGISVLRALLREMPNETYRYYGDSANAPYGTKSLEEVRRLTVSHVDRLIAEGAKAVVVACNTATSAAVYLGMAHIIPLPCPGLMEYIEHGDIQSKELLRFLERLFEPFEKEKLDGVVLGCTHYPFVSRQLQDVLGEGVQLFEGGPGTARETKRRLAEAGLLGKGTQRGSVQFENSEQSDEKKRLCEKLLRI